MKTRRHRPIPKTLPLSDVLYGYITGHRRTTRIEVPVQLLVAAARAIERPRDCRAEFQACSELVERADRVVTKALSVFNVITKVTPDCACRRRR